jgi:succinate dehydrogenase / fumarate reductase, flavoprotein subunit
MEQALERLAELGARARRAGVEGHRQYNPGWHLALDLRNMLLVAESIAKAALERQESRGGHTRDDFPKPDGEWGTKNLVVTLADDRESVMLNPQPLPPMPDDLQKFFE